MESKIDKFDPTNGAKAFSYFGTIVKRWLINYNNNNYKRIKQIGSFSDIEESFEELIDLEAPTAKTLSFYLDEWIQEPYDNLYDMFDKEQDLRIADAVLTVFRTRSDLEIFKKKALYIYIREITACETPALTRVINHLKQDWYKKYQDKFDRGLLSNNPL